MTFEQFLAYMQSEGIGAVLGVLLSFGVEWWPAFNQLADRLKVLVILGISMGIPLSAVTVAALMGYQPWGFEQSYWPAIFAGGTFFLVNQATYLTTAPKALRDLFGRA